MAYWASAHSAQFGAQIPTRSPSSRPAATSPRASASTSRSSSAQVQRRPLATSTSASRSGRAATVLSKLAPIVSSSSGGSSSPAAYDSDLQTSHPGCQTGPMSATRLHVTRVGEQGPVIAFCHGLFGQGRNWTQIAKGLSADHRVLLIDMPNHGRSPWTESFDYLDLADSVAAELEEVGPVTLVGHSMGGKIAMCVALRHPELVERLAVVDVSPVAYDSGREFVGYIETMRGLDLTALDRREQADEALREAVPNPTVRSFLLQNLRRTARRVAVAAQPRPAGRLDAPARRLAG